MTEQYLPKHRFNFYGLLALFLGGLVPTIVFTLLIMVMNLSLDLNINLNTNLFIVIFSTLIMWVGAIISYNFFICKRQTGQNLRFNLSTTTLKTWFIIVPMMLGLMLINDFITGLIPTDTGIFKDLYKAYSGAIQNIAQDFSVLFILTCLIAPICEEMVFRGIIQQGLINNGINPTKAIVFSAFLFGLVHANPWQFVGGLLFGLLLGQVYFRTKSLLLSIFLHFFNNFLSILILQFSGEESISQTFGLSPFLMLFIGIVLFSVFYSLFYTIYIKGKIEKN